MSVLAFAMIILWICNKALHNTKPLLSGHALFASLILVGITIGTIDYLFFDSVLTIFRNDRDVVMIIILSSIVTVIAGYLLARFCCFVVNDKLEKVVDGLTTTTYEE